MDAAVFIAALEKVGTPGLSGVAFVGLAIWMVRELIRMRRELLEQRLMREKGLLSNLKELGELKKSLSPEKVATLEDYFGGATAKTGDPPAHDEFWWRFKWAGLFAFAVTAARYLAVLLLDGADGAMENTIAPRVGANILTPKAAVVPQSVFQPIRMIIGMMIGIVIIPLITGYLVGKYPSDKRNLGNVAIMAIAISLAIPFGFAIVILVPLSLML